MGRTGGAFMQNRMRTRAALVCACAMLTQPALPNPPAAAPSSPDLPPSSIKESTKISRAYARGRSVHLTLVRREAERQGLPPDVADAVAQVESAYNPEAVGGIGEIGLMQVRPETARLLGHRGSVEALFEPETNVRFGVAYLSRAWRLAEGDLCRALMKYRAGHREEQMTPLSVEYCRRARIHLASIKSPLAGAPLPAAAAPEDGALQASPEGRAKGRRLAVRLLRGSSRMAREMRSRQTWTAHASGVKDIPTRGMPVALPPSWGSSRMAREMRSRQIWAAHQARMLAIKERLRPDKSLIPACV
jgi:hypothetical protein